MHKLSQNQIIIYNQGQIYFLSKEELVLLPKKLITNSEYYRKYRILSREFGITNSNPDNGDPCKYCKHLEKENNNKTCQYIPNPNLPEIIVKIEKELIPELKIPIAIRLRHCALDDAIRKSLTDLNLLTKFEQEKPKNFNIENFFFQEEIKTISDYYKAYKQARTFFE